MNTFILKGGLGNRFRTGKRRGSWGGGNLIPHIFKKKVLGREGERSYLERDCKKKKRTSEEGTGNLF